MNQTNSAFTQALERVLGIRPGSIVLVSARVLEEWIP
jgi:hypothetical protein